MQVYPLDALYTLDNKRRRATSELLQDAVRAEVRRRELLAEGDKYVAELIAEVGKPTARQRAAATCSAVDALVVAHAEPAGTVLTSNPQDVQALAAYRIDRRHPRANVPQSRRPTTACAYAAASRFCRCGRGSTAVHWAHMAGTLEDEVRELEEQLVTPSVRASPAALDHLISDQFVEFGSSGRVYTKPDVIALLLAAPSVTSSVTDFQVLAVSADVALATYRTAGSVRSSLWRREGQAWRIVFHQGTPTNVGQTT